MYYRLSILIISLTLCACSYLPQSYEVDTDLVITENADFILIENSFITDSKTLFIYYPGGLVDPHAYISMLEGIVKAGYPSLIIKADANLAIVNLSKAEKIVRDFPAYDHYILGGHSLGAAVTCIVANRNRGLFDGLVVMAGYPTENADLSNWQEGSMLLFDASNDKVIDREKLEDAKSFMQPISFLKDPSEIPSPSTGKTLWVEITGGNHGQYGDYGMQNGDGSATISKDDQHFLLQEYIIEYFKKNNW